MESQPESKPDTSRPDTRNALTIPQQTAIATRVERPQEEWVDTVELKRSVAGPGMMGTVLIILFVFGFLMWAALIPLAGGAVAPGVIIPDGNKKTVQHLEGGIIKRLLVRDGDPVRSGQTLVELEPVQAQAVHDTLYKQQRTLRITRARLEAERDNRSVVVFAEEVMPSRLPPEVEREVQTLINDQRQLFEARRAAHIARKDVLTQRVQQLAEQIKGFEAQVASTTEQLGYIRDELSGKQVLFNKGYLPKPELLKLQRAAAEIFGKRGEYIANISRSMQQIGETRMQLIQLDAERADQVAQQLEQARGELAKIEEQLTASSDVLKRTAIVAPVDGVVVNLKFKTEGGVVLKGEPIMDVVPQEEALQIDAKVSPIDIDVVRTGLNVQVQLTAFTGRNMPRVSGRVVNVSADRLVDEQTKQPFYLTRVEVNREELKRVAPNVTLVPGMPADVLIVTQERTLLGYLFQPFRDALWRSFREV